ncbi:MAG: peroxide stress protein YaaA [Actinobacteria bacterium]|nr:peroxide stress protein YaaA [Actinomycetota bacterium]
MLILLPPSEKKSTQPGAAIEVYTGVLYKALDWQSLNKESQARGQKSIAIISAKYGVLQPLDAIEPYKQKINNAAMRPEVTEILNARKATLIVDCRSSTYKGVWTPPAQASVEIKVFTNLDGEKKVVTHMSKKTRGEITRLILQSRSIPTNPQELCAVISTTFDCELIAPNQSGPWVLEVGSLKP